jgi:asparagine synthetase B (glutamine-hydrolysing)
MGPVNLAPLANVVAYLDRNPSRLAMLERALNGRFDAIWSPLPGCLMATHPLPRSVPDSHDLRAAGIAFAEGREAIGPRSLTDLALESLPGAVGFVRADRDKLDVVRSGAGTVPWYVWQDGERALVTTTFTELVRLLPVTPQLDPLVCGLWASFQPMFPGARSFLRGVTVIPAGHVAEVRAGRAVRPRLWWNPWPEELRWPSRAARASHVEGFREAVLTTLDREVAEEPVNLLTLSGGVDSSALAYLVGRHLRRPLAALSFVPPAEGPEAPLEASYLDPLVNDLAITRHVRHPLDGMRRMSFVPGTPSVVFPVCHPALQVLPRLVEEWGVEVLVGGEFADEICGGWFAYPDWLDRVSPLHLVLGAKALPRGRRDLRAWAGRRRPGRLLAGPWPESLATWVRPEVEEEYQAWRAVQLSDLRASAAPHRYQRALLASQEGVTAMNWEVCSFLGVRRTFPFLAAQVLEVVAACHPV